MLSRSDCELCFCRLHLRKCQCREKTPPCRNCPKCKEVVEVANIADPGEQQAACQDRLQCDICACRCARPQTCNLAQSCTVFARA